MLVFDIYTLQQCKYLCHQSVEKLSEKLETSLNRKMRTRRGYLKSFIKVVLILQLWKPLTVLKSVHVLHLGRPVISYGEIKFFRFSPKMTPRALLVNRIVFVINVASHLRSRFDIQQFFITPRK